MKQSPRPKESEESKKPKESKELTAQPSVAAVAKTDKGSPRLDAVAGVAAMTGKSPEVKKQTKMRSSIACSRCRKSKIRCENQGVGTKCASCVNSQKECLYPTPATGQSATPKRSEPVNGARLEGEADVKRIRSRPSEAVRKQWQRDENTNPLESPHINLPMWREIHNIFSLHFSTELPFVHESTLFKWAAQPATERLSEVEDFLLGLLTLTARFHPDLIRHHKAGRPNDKDYIASDFYANALIHRLDVAALCKPSVERCQALLMLGLYSWSMCRGVQAWTFIGNALS